MYLPLPLLRMPEWWLKCSKIMKLLITKIYSNDKITAISIYINTNYIIYTIYHKSMWVGFYKYFFILIAHWAAKAPSTTLWSADTIIYITSAILYY